MQLHGRTQQAEGRCFAVKKCLFVVFFAYSSGFNSCGRITCCPCWLICCRPPADSIYTALWEAFDGLGLNWRFAEAAASKQSWAACLTRILAVCISIGGSLVTALLLGLTSGGDRTSQVPAAGFDLNWGQRPSQTACLSSSLGMHSAPIMIQMHGIVPQQHLHTQKQRAIQGCPAR